MTSHKIGGREGDFVKKDMCAAAFVAQGLHQNGEKWTVAAPRLRWGTHLVKPRMETSYIARCVPLSTCPMVFARYSFPSMSLRMT